MNIPDKLHVEIRELERQLADDTEKLEKTHSEKSDTQMQYQSLYSQMGWRDKYLGGRLGGNRQMSKSAKELKARINQYDSQISEAKTKVTAIEKNIYDSLKGYLIQNDDTCKQFQAFLDKIEEIRKVVECYIEKVDDALSQIDDAKGMETLDLFSQNKGISLLSHLENSEANDAMQRVKDSTEQFQEDLRKYNNFIKNYCVQKLDGIKVDDTLDFILDMTLDAFNFMSFFVLEDLSNAESKLTKLKSEVQEIQDEVKKQHEETEAKMKSYLSDIRRKLKWEKKIIN